MKKLIPVITDRLSGKPNNEKDLWNSEWTISLLDEPDTTVGILRLLKSKVPGEVSISIELDPEFRNHGYGTELFYGMAMFALGPGRMKELFASCKNENRICRRALEKAKFVYRENKDGLDHYSMRKDKSAWTGLYICIGVLGGMILGLLISNLWAGFIIGVLAGLLIGRFLEEKEKE